MLVGDQYSMNVGAIDLTTLSCCHRNDSKTNEAVWRVTSACLRTEHCCQILREISIQVYENKPKRGDYKAMKNKPNVAYISTWQHCVNHVNNSHVCRRLTWHLAVSPPPHIDTACQNMLGDGLLRLRSNYALWGFLIQPKTTRNKLKLWITTFTGITQWYFFSSSKCDLWSASTWNKARWNWKCILFLFLLMLAFVRQWECIWNSLWSYVWASAS